MACLEKQLRRAGLTFAYLVLGVFLLTGMSTLSYATAGTLDQEFVPTVTASQSLFSSLSFGQIFTVGIDGTLSSFDVYLDNPASVTSLLDWEIQSTTSGLPDGTVLASGTIDGTSVGTTQWVSVDVSSAAIPVAIDDVYAIVITGRVASGSPLYWLVASDPYATYAGGERVRKYNPSGSWLVSASDDFGFRTYVPEPSQTSLTLVALCTLLAGAWIRRTAIEN